MDDKAGKPLGIQKHIRRRPLAAFGNSDGDLQMLQWTTAGHGLRFALLVHHTDAEREWAYDRQPNIGALDKAWMRHRRKGGSSSTCDAIGKGSSRSSNGSGAPV